MSECKCFMKSGCQGVSISRHFQAHVSLPSPRVRWVSTISKSVTVFPICRMLVEVKMLPRSPACISVRPDGQIVEKKGGVEVAWALHLAPCFT